MPPNDTRSSQPSLFRRWTTVCSNFFSTLGSVGRLVATGESATTHLEHTDVRFEATDVKSRNVIVTGFSILGAMWLFALILFFAFRYFQTNVPGAFTTAPPNAPATILPPQPRLQVSPRADLQQQLAYENGELHRYSWADQSKGIITIPIDRAMEIIAKRGIPPQKAPAELKLYRPAAGTRDTGFEGKVEEPR